MLLSAKEIINKSLELFKRDLQLWVWYMLVSFVAALLGLLLVFNPSIILFLATLGISSTVIDILNVLLILLLTLFDIWFHLALVRAIHTRLFNQPSVSVKQQFSQTRHLLAKTVGISLVVAIIVFFPLGLSLVGLSVAGFESLILGGLKGAGFIYLFLGLLGLYGIFHCIYFSIKYALSYYVVAIDEKNIGESLHQGNKLTHGRMGQILWRLVAPVVLFLFIYILSNYIFTALAKLVGGNFITGLANILSLLVSTAVAVLCVISTVILYEDAKAKPVALTDVKKA